jgi:tryptophanyl-tRNA synthetase
MLSGEIKAELIGVLTELTKTHQERRAAVTEADLDTFMSTATRKPEDLFG